MLDIQKPSSSFFSFFFFFFFFRIFLQIDVAKFNEIYCFEKCSTILSDCDTSY